MGKMANFMLCILHHNLFLKLAFGLTLGTQALRVDGSRPTSQATPSSTSDVGPWCGRRPSLPESFEQSRQDQGTSEAWHTPR